MLARPVALAVALSLVSSARPAQAQPPESRKQAAVLLLSLLAYDGNLRARAGKGIAVAVTWRGGDPSSGAAQQLARVLEEVSTDRRVGGESIRVLAIPYVDAARLEATLAAENAAALYVGSGLESEVAAISAATRRTSVLSFAGSEAQIRQGLAVGLLNRDGKLAVLVNLAASRSEGANFDSRMLRHVEVIR